MNKLWTKNKQIDPLIEAFETGEDLLFDQKLLPFDIWGTMAHVKMLVKINMLSEKEGEQIVKALQTMLTLWEKGEISLKIGDEDMHTKIENYLIEKLGDIGKKVHTGRSRNDQILTVLRLYGKEMLLAIGREALMLAEDFARFAKAYEFIPMPGYTHMQKAMPSSVGMWAGSIAESLLDDVGQVQAVYMLNDQSPLGSGAGYGVPLPLDRAYSAGLLGFAKVQNNALYVQNSRGKIEATILAALIQLQLSLNKFANDLLLFTTPEFDYFTVGEKLVSGSSIMPQKRNFDTAELLRSKVHVLLGNYTQIVGIAGNVLSGYNRDFQDMKKPFVESLHLTRECLQVAQQIIAHISPNIPKLQKAMTPELFASHNAFALVAKGVPFRDAYFTAKKQPSATQKKDIEKILQQATHLGATGNLGLSKIKTSVRQEKKIWKQKEHAFRKAINSLSRGGENQ